SRLCWIVLGYGLELIAKLFSHPPHRHSPQTTSTPSLPQSNKKLSPSQSYDFSIARIQYEQQNDIVLQRKIKEVKNVPKSHAYDIKDDLFYKLLPRGGTKIKLLYIPLTMIEEILSAHHDHPLSGHFGVERTWENLRNKYYWPNMKQSVSNYIKSCPECSRFNIDRHKPSGLLQPIEPPAEIFQVLEIDWWISLSKSLDGNKYVLVITDRLSGYVFAKASPTNKAQDTARILLTEVILVHEARDKVISDQGSHFNNELLQAITSLIGCKHVFSTPYHPQTNGQTERWNATLATQIAKYCNENQDNWDTYLPSIVFAYNHGIHNSSGFIPYQLAFGRKARSPFDAPHTSFTFKKPHDYWSEVCQYKNIVIKQAKLNILRHQQVTKQRYDSNRQDQDYKINDLVWMKVLVGRSKLDERYTGPVRVIQVLGLLTYLVQDDELQQFQVHSNNIKRVYPRDQDIPFI
ncbi:unnamed protein product, partial [Didymodactylos carnosus]